jgi:hypothetical protein
MVADSHDGLLGCAEVGVFEERGGLVPGREEKPPIVGVRHRRHRHLELRDPNSMDRLFVLAYAGPTHEELASRDEDALEEGLFRT